MSNSDNNHESHGNTKEFTIIVNARPKVVTGKELSFDQIVVLALGIVQADENTIFTVTYTRGEGNQQGTLLAGDTVEIKDGMIFNVTKTIKS